MEIVLDGRLWGKDLRGEGVSYEQRFRPEEGDVDHNLCLKILMERKADPNPTLNHEKRPSHIFNAIKNPKNLDTFISYVKGNRALCSDILNQKNKFGMTPLCIVAETPDKVSEESARLLLEGGALPTEGQINPLLLALKSKNYPVMRLLYKYGADPNHGSPDLNAIQLALEQNDSHLLREVLDWKETILEYSLLDTQKRNIFHLIA